MFYALKDFITTVLKIIFSPIANIGNILWLSGFDSQSELFTYFHAMVYKVA